MRNILLIAIATFGFISASCGRTPEKRCLEDIYKDALASIIDSTASSQQVLDVMNEYADSLYSEFIHSDPNDFGWRCMLQKMAGDGVSVCLDYLFDESTRSGFSELIRKFDRVITTWRVLPGGETFIKEVYFVANKETDHERDEMMNFIIQTGENPKSLVLIPDDDEDERIIARFCPLAPEGSDIPFDYDSGITFEPDSLMHGDYGRCYSFNGNKFFEQMMAYDILFVTYTDGDGIESVMVRLEKFHEQVKSLSCQAK